MAMSETALEGLLAQLRKFFFPRGEDCGRPVRAVRTTQKGEMRMSPNARWIPFTANEYISATHSDFRWEARLDPGKLVPTVVTDAYENRHGFLAVKLGGAVQIKKFTGPNFDKGELQRYLASIALCPMMLLNHESLEWRLAGPSTVSVRDRSDKAQATVDWELAQGGRPLAIRALRPRLAGKDVILTQWTATTREFREVEGMRLATHLEVAWQGSEGEFTYFREQIASIELVR